MKICDKCNLSKPYLASVGASGKPKWVDFKGRVWTANTCNSCHRTELRKKREQTKPVLEMTHRYCRKCGNQLDVSRYFNCTTCVKKLEYCDEATIYYGETSEDLGEELK